MSSDRRQEDRVPTSFRVRLQYPDVDTFVERYATNVSRGGIFIQSQRTQPTGTVIRFEFQLVDKSAVIRGEGRVAWAVPFDPAHPERTYGMGVRFTRLDVKSKKIIDEMVGARMARGERDPGLQPPTPDAARTEEALRSSAAPKPKPEPAREEPPEAEPPKPEPPKPEPPKVAARPTPPPPPVPPPAPKPGALGAPDRSPVRDMDLGSLGDISVDVRALLHKTLGRARVAAADADQLLADLAQGVGDVARGRSADGGARPSARPTPPPPQPKKASVPAVAAPPKEPEGPPHDPSEDSSVKRVIRDLFEDADVGEGPGTDEGPPPLPELLEVPVSQDEEPKTGAAAPPKVPAPDSRGSLASLFDDEDFPATPRPAAAAPTAGFEGDVPAEERSSVSSRTSFPEVDAEMLTALDEPLEDDFDRRPSIPPATPPQAADLDTPIYDDFSGSGGERPDVEILLSDEPSEGDRPLAATPLPPPPVEGEEETPEEGAPDDDRPKKGFFKKLFGK